MRKIVCALAVCCTAPVAAEQCLAGNDAQSAPFAGDGEVIRVMGAGKLGAPPHPAERTLVSTVAARPAPVNRAEAAQGKGKNAGEHEGSHNGQMLLTALAVMFAIALRRIGASA
jgi:hypothetical protein